MSGAALKQPPLNAAAHHVCREHGADVPWGQHLQCAAGKGTSSLECNVTLLAP